MQLNKIVIACFKKDLFLLRPCVASVRYWYPEVEVFLLKDYINGEFSTKEIEDNFNVKIFPSNKKIFGWPWSKLAVIFHTNRDKFLFLDSDIVLLGKVIDKLNAYNDDFIVTGIEDSDHLSHNVNAHYIDMDKIRNIDQVYKYPGYAFNGGQIVISSGMLTENDFELVINFSAQIKNKYPEIFKHGDQGILNYVFAKAHQENKIKLKYSDFWIWPGTKQAEEIDLSSIRSKVGIPFVLHWAGMKPIDFRKFARYDILNFFTDCYYKQIRYGSLKKWYRNATKLSVAYVKILKYKLIGQQYEK